MKALRFGGVTAGDARQACARTGLYSPFIRLNKDEDFATSEDMTKGLTPILFWDGMASECLRILKSFEEL